MSELSGLRRVELDLTARWSQLAQGTLPRGNYGKLRLELQRFALAGTYDGAPFKLEVREHQTFELSCGDGWRVEVGTKSTVSLVSDPTLWMLEGDRREPLDPTDEKTRSELVDRFEKSLKVVRDDDRNGIEDTYGKGP